MNRNRSLAAPMVLGLLVPAWAAGHGPNPDKHGHDDSTKPERMPGASRSPAA